MLGGGAEKLGDTKAPISFIANVLAQLGTRHIRKGAKG